MNGQDFLRIVNEAFAPFLQEIGFSADIPSLSGKYYRASFRNATNIVSISFEPGERFLLVLIFSIENNQISDIDDRSKTPRLADLNRRYFRSITDAERNVNDLIFSSVKTEDDDEHLLLKTAKELRLVLPKYLCHY